MPVCKFWSQGNCRYGDNCWFEHPPQNRGYNQGNQNLFRNQGKGGSKNPYVWQNPASSEKTKTQNSSTPESNISEIIETISKDVEIWESGKMWPFSCFSYIGDMPSFPGFDDVSPEELRCEAYLEGKSAGTMNIYINKEMQMTIEINAKRDQLKKSILNPAIKAKLASIIEDIKKMRLPALHIGAKFGSGSQLFSVPAAKTNLFDKAANSSSTFFGGSSSSGAGAGLFGKAAATNVFGGSSTSSSSNNLFGKSSSAGNIFGSGNATVSPSVFGNATSLFTSKGSTQNSVFGGSNVPSNLSAPFGTNNSGLFGKGGNSGSVFGNSSEMSTNHQFAPTNLTFAPSSGGSTGVSASVFGGNSAQSVSSNTTTLFGKTVSQNTASSINLPANNNPSQGSVVSSTTGSTCAKLAIYTPVSELSEAEKEQFLSEKFTIGCIPVKPPPREYC